MPSTAARINEIGPLLRRRHGQPVRRVAVRLGLSCPNRDGTLARGGCLYCAEHEEAPAPPTVGEQLRRGLARRGAGAAFVAYLQDHTATHLAPERLDEALREVRRTAGLVGIAVGTRPDSLPPPILDVLAAHATHVDVLLELGLQTADDTTLRFHRRMHDVACFERACSAAQARRLRVGAHVILGLPTPVAGDDGPLRVEGTAEAAATARLLARCGVVAVKLHNCHVLEGTPLAALWRAGRFAPPELAGYVERAVAFLEHLPASVEVHRLTGEERSPLLLAPTFTARKSETVEQIRAALERRGTRQGQRCAPDCPAAPPQIS